MTSQLYEILLSLPKKNLLHLMILALEEMQHYNGRTDFTCIMLAVGAKENNGKWIINKKEIIKNTDDVPFIE